MSVHLLKNLDHLKEIFNGRRVSLFLDYDGTVTPIVARPERASLSYQMKEILRKLARAYPTAIISGRSLKDVRRKVGIPGIAYAGNHGTEIWDEDYTMVFDAGAEYKRELKKIEEELRSLALSFRGVIVENKGHSLTLHYRLLDTHNQRLFTQRYEETVRDALQRGVVRLAFSKKAFEVRPPGDWNKGSAVRWLLERKHFASTFPVYVGDDETDKDAFRAIAGRGMSVFVGAETEAADYHLVAQTEVKTFLKWLCNHPVPGGAMFGSF